MESTTRCSTRHKDSPKGTLLPCARHGHSSGLCGAAGREIHIPHPQLRMSGQELQGSLVQSKQAGTCSMAVLGGTALCPCIPSSHCPWKRAQALTSTPANSQHPRGKQQQTAQGLSSCQQPGKCSSPGAGHTARLAIPEPPCSERLCRAPKLPDTDPECTQTQWQLGPKMSTCI